MGKKQTSFLILQGMIEVNSEHEKASHFLGKKQTSFLGNKQTSFLVLQVMIEVILNMKKQVNFWVKSKLLFTNI